ncbi:hypothetical protein PR202_gb02649 [Eleusine coracana subsp. coracana]|uniref:Uncharacterized protein n=1 Tax=Eleusine coracana subsp. coracana TaxID=191504 RepID=A0AAV5DZ16_ELECO|nr:hypothetical protein PR202_gb02649 [Eleusine coracana subsp. coracana]
MACPGPSPQIAHGPREIRAVLDLTCGGAGPSEVEIRRARTTMAQDRGRGEETEVEEWRRIGGRSGDPISLRVTNVVLTASDLPLAFGQAASRRPG